MLVEIQKRQALLLPEDEETEPISYPVISLIAYTAVYLAVGLLLAYFIISGIDLNISISAKKLVYLLSMILVGIAHVALFPRLLPFFSNGLPRTRFLYSLCLSILIGIMTAVVFITQDFHKPVLAVAGAFSFFFPTVILQCWYCFNSILTTHSYTPWELPATAPARKIANIFLNSFEVTIKVKVNYFDMKEMDFPTTAPGNVQIGKLIHEFFIDIEDSHRAIQVKDQHQHPYRWKLLLKRRFSSRFLDPKLTVSESGIKQNDIILLDRV